MSLWTARALDEECAPDAYCDLSSSCPGRCRLRGAEGYGCERIEDCASGLICGPGQLCIPPVALADRCTETSQCASGMLCVDGLLGRQCAPQQQLYEPAAVALCGRSEDTWVCGIDGWACAVPGLAVPCNPRSLVSGHACHPGVPDPCPDNQYCADVAPSMGDVDGTCTALPTDGMACVPVVGRPACADGNVCEGGTCVAMHINGESCTTNADCYGANCRGGTCAPPTYCP
jgi:hypothetical protein